MINLLPPQDVHNIMYARHNLRLLKWIAVLIIAIAGVGVMVGAGRMIIDRSAKQVASQVKAGQTQLKVQKLDETKTRVEDISGSLKLATQVLSRQVVLSKLIPQIGAILPNGTALSGLQLSNTEGGMDLSVSARDYQTATQVQVNLQDPANKLFEKADINTINCAASDDPRYPCEASYRVLFTKDNPFSFLKQGNP